MKYLLLLSMLCGSLSASFAQSKTNTDTSLKFNQWYTKLERKWVVLNKSDTAKTYSYGYIYIDSQAGFTYDLQGVFTADKNNKYVNDPSVFKGQSVKYRIAPNWQLVALLPPTHFAELGIQPEPDWVKSYYTYTDTVAHNYRWGWIYNDLNESELALPYLNKANTIKPHEPNIEFELAFAYNVLSDYDNAIKVLETAIPNKPDNMVFYKELGYAYLKKKLYNQAIATYKKGIDNAPDKKSDAKGELAFNLASCYKSTGNMADYKTWMQKAKEFALPESPYYQQIIDAGF
jgi:tetratricopeptide (TPR) repeat protein